MVEKYNLWIKENYPDQKSAYGICREACKEMAQTFPELEITNGFVYVYSWNRKRQHWWLKTENGEIIDPTKAQFPGLIDYEEVDDSHPVRNFPTCRCANCGKYYYLKEDSCSTVCSDKCYAEYVDYLTKETA